MLKQIFFPNHFYFGSDIEIAKKENNDVFYKKFRKMKYDKFIKSLFILEKLQKEDFIPTLLHYTNNLEIYTTDCGNLLSIFTLPDDWEKQLIEIKKKSMNYPFLIKDWGLWEINPFLINNLCVKKDKIYFVDFGDVEPAGPKQIEDYFNKKIKSIKLILKYSYLYLLFHYPRRIFIMMLRKLQRPYNWILLFSFYFCLNQNKLFSFSLYNVNEYLYSKL
jgi:hypothetical protein